MLAIFIDFSWIPFFKELLSDSRLVSEIRLNPIDRLGRTMGLLRLREAALFCFVSVFVNFPKVSEVGIGFIPLKL